MAKALTLENALSDDRKPVKVDGESTGLLIGGKDVHIEGKSSVGGDLTVDGDLKINGNHLTFGHGEIVHNNADGSITASTPVFWIDGASAYTGDATLLIYADSGYDAKIQFWESSAIKWTVGNDADDSDKLKFDVENTAVGGATKMTLDASGNLTLVGDLAVNGDTITTDGNATFDSGGGIDLDSHSGVFKASKAGAEFSAANSAYAGMILGYTRLQGDLTNQSSFEIQNSMTVEDATHQITFITPPSENVEIETSFLMNIGSTDTEINIGISDNSTYNSIGVQFEYDGGGVIYSDDESDDHIVVAKFILGASELAAIGSSNTFYIGLSTGGATKIAYLTYGVRASHVICDDPFVIKATALPATIYDGQ